MCSNWLILSHTNPPQPPVQCANPSKIVPSLSSTYIPAEGVFDGRREGVPKVQGAGDVRRRDNHDELLVRRHALAKTIKTKQSPGRNQQGPGVKTKNNQGYPLPCLTLIAVTT